MGLSFPKAAHRLQPHRHTVGAKVEKEPALKPLFALIQAGQTVEQALDLLASGDAPGATAFGKSQPTQRNPSQTMKPSAAPRFSTPWVLGF